MLRARRVSRGWGFLKSSGSDGVRNSAVRDGILPKSIRGPRRDNDAGKGGMNVNCISSGRDLGVLILVSGIRGSKSVMYNRGRDNVAVWNRGVRVMGWILVRNGRRVSRRRLRSRYTPFTSTGRMTLHTTVSTIRRHILTNNFLP